MTNIKDTIMTATIPGLLVYKALKESGGFSDAVKYECGFFLPPSIFMIGADYNKYPLEDIVSAAAVLYFGVRLLKVCQ